jgi:hypothetical protein
MYNGSVPFFIPGDLGDALALASEYDIIPVSVVTIIIEA